MTNLAAKLEFETKLNNTFSDLMDLVYLRVDTLKQELEEISDNFKKQIEEYKADILE